MLNKKYSVIIDNYLQFMITSLGFVAALSWNSAFQKHFEQSKYLKKIGPGIYAFVVTLLIFVVISTLNFIKSNYEKQMDINSKNLKKE